MCKPSDVFVADFPIIFSLVGVEKMDPSQEEKPGHQHS
jgi:hypothetical protein